MALKVALIAQQARLHTIKQRPQLSKVILDRRARQSQPVLGTQCARHPGHFGAGIFDGLRLIEDEEVVILREQDFAVELQE